MFIAVVDWTAENRIAKYQDFELEAEALAHIQKVGHGFVAPDPGGGFADWLVDARARTLSHSPLPEPLAVKLPPTDAKIVAQALMDKSVLSQVDLDAARVKLAG